MKERDIFAAHALIGLLSSGRFNSVALEDLSPMLIANAVYEIADAMLHSRQYDSPITRIPK